MWDTTVERWKKELREEWFARWREEDLEQGREEGERKTEEKVLLRQLERKFGPVDSRTRARIRRAGSDRLLEWLDRVLTAERLEQVFEG